jgi:hypothetical protein
LRLQVEARLPPRVIQLPHLCLLGSSTGVFWPKTASFQNVVNCFPLFDGWTYPTKDLEFPPEVS